MHDEGTKRRNRHVGTEMVSSSVASQIYAEKARFWFDSWLMSDMVSSTSGTQVEAFRMVPSVQNFFKPTLVITKHDSSIGYPSSPPGWKMHRL